MVSPFIKVRIVEEVSLNCTAYTYYVTLMAKPSIRTVQTRYESKKC